MPGYTREEYADMLLAYGAAHSNARKARRIYQERYPNRRLPDRDTFPTTYRRFRETGNLNVRVPQAAVRQLPVEIDQQILAAFEEDPTTSTRVVAAALGVSQWKVWSVMHGDHQHPYHYTPVQDTKSKRNLKKEESSHKEASRTKPGLLLIENDRTSIPKSKLIKISKDDNENKGTSKIKLLKKKLSKKRKIIVVGKNDTNFETVTLTRTNNVLKKHLHNLEILLTNSNATPIQCKGGIGYVCCFCKNQFVDPADLKKHTLVDHDEEMKSNFMANVPFTNFIVKLDITDLCCNKCNEKSPSVEKFVEHLTSSHKITYNTDIKSQIVPFQFHEDSIHCVTCSTIFRSFKIALEHMNLHYRNYICETCGSGFVNRRILHAHTLRHKTGVFTCSFCGKIFDTNVKKRDHERAVHILLSKRSKCGYCGEKFSDYTKKNQHEVKMHGVKPTVLNCNACDKTFDNQRSLTVHTKNYHMVRRRTSNN